jgi:entericidin B
MGLWPQRYPRCCFAGNTDIATNGSHIAQTEIFHPSTEKDYIMTKKLLSSLFLISLVSIFAGCNTIEGAGEDLESGGEAIQRESREARD